MQWQLELRVIYATAERTSVPPPSQTCHCQDTHTNLKPGLEGHTRDSDHWHRDERDTGPRLAQLELPVVTVTVTVAVTVPGRS
jgi:hypothetical protein